MTQKQEVLKYLKRNKLGITVWTAFDMGITRLSERIRELESDGWLFNRKVLHGENRHGKKVRIVKYQLIGHSTEE